MGDMTRRDLIKLFGAAAAFPVVARAQQPAMPVIGFLRGSPATGAEHLVAALGQGLRETGYVDGQNVVIEYRWADNYPERLPALAADLVSRQVSVIVASASTGALAAKAATSTIPIVFVTTVDPVKTGLVATLNRPGGNATGITYLTSALGGKRLEFLQQLVPAAKSVGVMVHPDQPSTEPLLSDLRAGAAVLGLQLIVSSVRGEQDFESAFADLVRQRASALVLGADPLLNSRSAQITALAARHKLPAIYTTTDWARAGGLMAWGVSLTDQYRLGGTYVGKILNGAKPADLPVWQPTKYELVINLKTAKALGLTVPDKLLALADEVIE
jgi:putative ABC transport system substrate-binding protein